MYESVQAHTAKLHGVQVKRAAGRCLQWSTAHARQSRGDSNHSKQVLENPLSCLDHAHFRKEAGEQFYGTLILLRQFCMVSFEEPGITELGMCVDITGLQRMQCFLEVV